MAPPIDTPTVPGPPGSKPGLRYVLFPNETGDIVCEQRWTKLGHSRDGWTIVRWATVTRDGAARRGAGRYYPLMYSQRCFEISPELFNGYWEAGT